jgi:hypothetical protein
MLRRLGYPGGPVGKPACGALSEIDGVEAVVAEDVNTVDS